MFETPRLQASRVRGFSSHSGFIGEGYSVPAFYQERTE
jgi:hypothetical protein